MLIRPLVATDEPFLWDALYYAVYVPPSKPAPEPDIVKQPELARYVSSWMSNPDDSGFMAEQDDNPVGAVWLRRWSGSERGYGFVDETIPELTISVLPDYRGQAIGTKLLRHLLSAASKRFPAVSLSVSESNPVRELYKREGFIPVGTPEGGSITMIKRFTS